MRARDAAQVGAIAEELKNAGVRVWFADTDMPKDVNPEREVERILSVVRVVLFFVSRASSRKTAQAQLQQVLSRRVLGQTAPLVVPVLLEKAAMPPLLKDTNWIDGRGSAKSAAYSILRIIEYYVERSRPR